MKRTLKAAVLLFALQAGLWAGGYKKVNISRSFELKGLKQLRLDIKLPDAKMQLRTWKEARAEVKLRIMWKGKAPSYHVGLEGGTLEVEVHRRCLFFGCGGPLKVEAEVWVPEPLMGSVRICDGELRLESQGLSKENELKVDVVDAELRMKGWRGKEFRLKSVDGNITVEDMQADYVNVVTVDGDVELMAAVLHELRCHLVDGDFQGISLRAPEGGRWKISSVDGDIALALADKGVSYELNLRSSDGNIKVDLDKLHLSARGKFRARAGEGDKILLIELSTVDGDITIKEE